MAVNDEPDRICVGLDDVLRLWLGVLQAGRWMLAQGFLEDFIEGGSGDFRGVILGDLFGELE